MARIVFDLDGTLVHSQPTIAAAGNAMLGRARPAGRCRSTTVAGFVGHGVRVLVERLLDHTGGVPGGGAGADVARFRALYAADPVTGTDALSRRARGARAAGRGGPRPRASAPRSPTRRPAPS